MLHLFIVDTEKNKISMFRNPQAIPRIGDKVLVSGSNNTDEVPSSVVKDVIWDFNFDNKAKDCNQFTVAVNVMIGEL